LGSPPTTSQLLAVRSFSPTYRCRTASRRLVALLVAGAALASVVPAAAEAAPLYPDLRTLPPRDLRFDRTDVSFDGSGQFHNVLRFTNTVWNAGPGKLETRGQIDRTTLTGPAYQRVFDSEGGFAEHLVGGFYWHAQNHNHFHYEDWGRYELWDRADFDTWIASGRTVGEADLRGTKTTSCVMDEEFFTQLPGTPFPAVYPSGGCLLDDEDDTELIQGLSVGWGDTYDYYRDEQWIDLDQGSLADGQYVLRSVTDPENKIYESAGKADPSREGAPVNEGIVYFTIDDGDVVDTDTPTGTVAINNVDESTGVKKVTVKVTGRDDVSGVDQVRVSADGVNWRTHSYTSSGSTPTAIICDLTDPQIGGGPNEGVRTIYAQFKDGSGKWGGTESDTIVYDPSATGASAYSDAVLADEPAGYWRLGEPSGTTANDSAGSNTGTYGAVPDQGADSLVPADPANAAATFDGVDDRVEVPHAESIAPSDEVAVEAWIEPDQLRSPGSYSGLVVKAGSYALQFNGPRLEFTVIRDTVRYRAQAAIGAIELDKAYHVVGTYDGTRVRLYVDGEQVASTALTGAIGESDESLGIGSRDNDDEFFAGTIDDVSVYGDALGAAQVEQHWEIGSEPPVPPDPTVDAPTGLTATTASQTRIELRWDDNADNETEHVIERDSTPAFGSPEAVLLGEGETAYSDTGLTPGTTYHYRVKARNATDESGWSNVASATTTATPPPPTDDYGQLVLADGPVSHWRLGEPSGSGAIDQRAVNPGAYAGAPALGSPGLLAGDGDDSAVAFDGADDYMGVSTSSTLSIGLPLTLEAWIRPDGLAGEQGIVGKDGSYALRLDGSRLVLELRTLAGPQALSTAAGAVVANQPQHVVATYDGEVRRLYLDGVEVEAEPLTGVIASSGGLFVGSRGGLSGFFDGTIDEVAVYSKALGADRVAAHRDEGAGTVAPPAETPVDPPVADPPPTPPVTSPPVTAPDRTCDRARATRRAALRRVRAARAGWHAAKRPTVRRKRRAALIRRKAALRKTTAHVGRACATRR
jgi:hypothetical protein